MLFHAASGISVLSTALGRQVWLNRGFYILFPNHYFVLIAASAECRKSVAVGIAKEILEEAKIVAVSAERITNADLLRQLHNIAKETGNSEMLIWADELRTFLSTEDTHKGVITTLTRLYTCPTYFENRTKTAGVDSLVNTCVNILAATTPADFAEIIPGAATGSGFVPRLLIVFQEEPREKIPWPMKNDSMKDALVADLVHIRHTLKGEYLLEPEAKEWWDEWYRKMKFPENPVLNGFYGRKHDYVLKLGMVLAASDADEMLIKQRHLQAALNFLNKLELSMVRAYEMVGATPTLKYADQVLGQIKKSPTGSLTRSQIQHKNWYKIDRETLTEILLYLEEAQLITRQPLRGPGHGERFKIKEEVNENPGV
jgi:hypothetical protein